MNKIDFNSGKVIYDEFHIDFTKPFSEQLDSLTEDLLQVKYADDYLLDLGWYPEHEADGKFVVQVIKEGKWEEPQYRACCNSKEDLMHILKTAVSLVNKWDKYSKVMPDAPR